MKTVDTAPEQRNRYSLSDADVIELARYALIIEKHYGRPMDIEWGKDGVDGKLYILQARPETVKSQRRRPRSSSATSSRAAAPCWPKAARSARRSAPARCASCTSIAEMDAVQPGDVLVTDMTDPNWEPVMKRAGADRHQPRRPHLPRGDHRARARHPGGGRLRRRDRAC